MPGMYYNYVYLFGSAIRARERSKSEAEVHPDIPTQSTLESVIMSVTAAEAFINELTAHLLREPLVFPDSSTYERSRMSRCAHFLQIVEEERLSLLVKYNIVALCLTEKKFEKGRNPYQDFANLISLRNHLVHFKSMDIFDRIQDGSSRFQHEALIKALQQKKLARKCQDGVVSSNLSLIQTVEMAEWACNTSRNIIASVLDMIPLPTADQGGMDPVYILRNLFENMRNV